VARRCTMLRGWPVHSKRVPREPLTEITTPSTRRPDIPRVITHRRFKDEVESWLEECRKVRNGSSKKTRRGLTNFSTAPSTLCNLRNISQKDGGKADETWGGNAAMNWYSYEG